MAPSPSPFHLPIDTGDILKSGTEETGWEVDEDDILEPPAFIPDPAPIGRDTDTEASSPEMIEEEGEILLAPMSQIEPSLEWEETVCEDVQDFFHALPKSESQDTQWEEQSTDSEEEEEEEFFAESGRRQSDDATLLPMDKIVDFLSDVPRNAFASSLFKSVPVGVSAFGGGPSKRLKCTMQQCIKPANNHNCPKQQALRKESCDQVNVECNFKYITASSGSYLMVSCSSCLKRIAKLVSWLANTRN